MRNNYSRIFWGLAFVCVGALMLLDRLEVIYFDFGEFIRNWWPLILIIVGLSMIFNRGSCCRGGDSGKRGTVES